MIFLFAVIFCVLLLTVKAFFRNKREASRLVFPKSCRGFFQGHLNQKSLCLNVLNGCLHLLIFISVFSAFCNFFPEFVFSAKVIFQFVKCMDMRKGI